MMGSLASSADGRTITSFGSFPQLCLAQQQLGNLSVAAPTSPEKQDALRRSRGSPMRKAPSLALSASGGGVSKRRGEALPSPACLAAGDNSAEETESQVRAVPSVCLPSPCGRASSQMRTALCVRVQSAL
jgi:hypothetical protein